MSTKICFIRHGRTNANIQMTIQGQVDNELSQMGEIDAKNVGTFLLNSQLNFDVILCSPLKRAHKTAIIVKDIIGFKQEIIQNPIFMEREFGEAEGLPINDENYQKIMNNSFKKMETDQTLCARSKEALDWILSNFKDKSILVVAHSHFIKSLFMQFDSQIHFNTTFGHRSLNLLEFEENHLIACQFNIRQNNLGERSK